MIVLTNFRSQMGASMLKICLGLQIALVHAAASYASDFGTPQAIKDSAVIVNSASSRPGHLAGQGGRPIIVLAQTPGTDESEREAAALRQLVETQQKKIALLEARIAELEKNAK